jgi:hypothetical protein
LISFLFSEVEGAFHVPDEPSSYRRAPLECWWQARRRWKIPLLKAFSYGWPGNLFFYYHNHIFPSQLTYIQRSKRLENILRENEQGWLRKYFTENIFQAKHWKIIWCYGFCLCWRWGNAFVYYHLFRGSSECWALLLFKWRKNSVNFS